MKELAKIIQGIPASPTISISDKAARMRAAGEDVISLAGGEPDFDTPPHIIEAGFEAIKAGETHYAAPSRGIPQLLEAIAGKLAHDNQITVDPKTDVLVTPGGKWALNLALRTLLNPGDEVLYLEPAWVSYRPMIILAGGAPVAVALDGDDNFSIDADALRARITPKTKAIMVNTPSNPTGRVLTSAEADAIAQVAQEADLYVISDEIYEKIIFDGRAHISVGCLPGMAERTITVNGFSKAYAMTGWRLGWLAGPTPVMKLAGKLLTQTVTSAATFTMHAAVAALNGPQEAIAEMSQAYKQRRDFMVGALNEIEGIACASIEGAFYLFPRFPKSDKDSVALADALLEHAGVAGVPGVAFGGSGEGYVRFSIGTAMSDLERAVGRIAAIADRL